MIWITEGERGWGYKGEKKNSIPKRNILQSAQKIAGL